MVDWKRCHVEDWLTGNIITYVFYLRYRYRLTLTFRSKIEMTFSLNFRTQRNKGVVYGITVVIPRLKVSRKVPTPKCQPPVLG